MQPMTTTGNIKGLKELRKILLTFPAKLREKVLTAGVRAAANAIVKRAKAGVVVGRGFTKKKFSRKGGAFTFKSSGTLHLRDTIKASVSRARNSSEIRFTVHAGRGRNTAHLIEFGTRPHYIAGRLNINGEWVRGVNHPGSRAKPFMRPALDGGMPFVTAAIIKAYKRNIKRITK